MTYAYAESTAVVGPLAPAAEPHSWDLCDHHAEKITAPLGWEMLRVNHIDIDDDEDLTALAEAVREPAVSPAGSSNPTGRRSTRWTPRTRTPPSIRSTSRSGSTMNGSAAGPTSVWSRTTLRRSEPASLRGGPQGAGVLSSA